jgi:hypothetical protein
MTGVSCRLQAGAGGEAPLIYLRPEEDHQPHHLILLDTKAVSFKIVTATTTPPNLPAS